jgi:hypothetical protein
MHRETPKQWNSSPSPVDLPQRPTQRWRVMHRENQKRWDSPPAPPDRTRWPSHAERAMNRENPKRSGAYALALANVHRSLGGGGAETLDNPEAMSRSTSDVQEKPEGSASESRATSGEPDVTRQETTLAREETIVAPQEHALTSEDPDTMDNVSGSAAVDPARIPREHGNTSGDPDPSVRIAAPTRYRTGDRARITANISDGADTIIFRRTRMTLITTQRERSVPDTSGKTEAMRPRTPC